MQPYQNYWMNNYPQPQYQQPMYQGSQQQMPVVNPYMEQLNQMRSLQQVPVNQGQMQNTVPGFIGKVVEDFGVITANDVPMDGNGAFFVKRDGSEIQVRNWTAQGTIDTKVFKPVLSDNPKQISGDAGKVEIGLSDDVTAVLKTYFEQINKRFDALEKSISPLD